MRAALYLRLSQSDDASTSIARQEVELRAHALREGWEVIVIFVDDGLSGGKVRAKAEEALRLLATNEVDVLAVWKFDRWSRQGLSAVAALIEALAESRDGLFVALRDGLDSRSPAWPIIAGVLAGVAQLERENTSLRVKSSHAALRTSGRFAGGQRPYGYVAVDNPDGPGRILTIVPEEARVLREAVDRVLAGETTYAVAHDFNDRGIPSRNGSRWSPSALRDILRGPALVGRVRHRGQVVRDEEGAPVSFWEPIVPVDTWHRVRAVLGERGVTGNAPHRAGARLLSGIATCAVCGRRLYVATQTYRRDPSRKVVAYVCHSKGNGKVCTRVSVNAAHLEAHVEERLLASLGDTPVFERIEADPGDAPERAEVERDIASTTAAMTEPGADLDALLSTLRLLHERRRTLAASPLPADVQLRPTGQTFAERWADADLMERHSLVAANVAVLAVSKGVRGRKPFDPSRVTLVAQPAYSAETGEPRAYTPGRAVS